MGARKWQIQDTNTRARLLLFHLHRYFHVKLCSDMATALLPGGHVAMPGDIFDQPKVGWGPEGMSVLWRTYQVRTRDSATHLLVHRTNPPTHSHT